MSFTKQTPTKPGAYWWKYETELDIAIVTEYGGRLYSSVNGKARQHVELVGGEWEGPLVTADEAQADLRVEKGEAMTDTPITDAAASPTMFIDGEPVVEIKICRRIERELQKAQADAAAMREALNAIPFPCPCCSYATLHAESCVIGSALAKGAGRDYVHRSEVEKAYDEGFNAGKAHSNPEDNRLASEFWNQSRARKIATGELNK